MYQALTGNKSINVVDGIWHVISISWVMMVDHGCINFNIHVYLICIRTWKVISSVDTAALAPKVHFLNAKLFSKVPEVKVIVTVTTVSVIVAVVMTMGVFAVL